MSLQRRQILILVDEHDNPTGKYADKGECHFGKGLHHRAFVVLLENSKGEVLLQLRKHVRWDNFWDVTAISHVLHFDDHNETYEEGANRALTDEMGIPPAGGDIKLTKIGGFNYFAKYHGHCENEYCAVLVGQYDGEIAPNKKVMYENKWVRKEVFFKDIKENPEKYTPWALLAVDLISQKSKLKTQNYPSTSSGSRAKSRDNSKLKSFNSYLEEAVHKIDKSLFEILARWEKKTSQIHPSLIPLVQEFIRSCKGGKRLRGVLVRLGYELAGGKKNNEIYKIAAAYEIFHTAILAHDDVIDRSLLRRGKPSLYKALGGDHYGISQTISLGDAGFFLALKTIAESRFSSKAKDRAIQIFIDSLLDTATGEMLDVALPKEGFAREEDVLAIAGYKTARYSFAGPLMVGAVLGGTNKNLLSGIEKLGENIGIAYQIQDDILGVFGDERETGKSTISDIIEGKATLLVAHAFKHADRKQLHLLKSSYGNKNASKTDVDAIRKIIVETGALAYARIKTMKYAKSAKATVEKLTIRDNIRRILFELSDFLVKRNT